MRAFEFINESKEKIPDSHAPATPGMRIHNKLDNSNPYHPWRFAASFLAGADGKNPYEHEPSRDGPMGQFLTTTAYTPEERAMLQQAEKAFGWEANPQKVTPDGSNEADSIHRTSPIKGFDGYRSKKKKKK